LGFCYGPYLTVLNQTPTNPYYKKIESRKVIRPESLVTQGNMKMTTSESEIGDMKILSERDKCELVWEYALSLGFKDDVVFNRVDGGCEIFMAIEDEDEDEDEEETV
jgi:hypothetical protein